MGKRNINKEVKPLPQSEFEKMAMSGVGEEFLMNEDDIFKSNKGVPESVLIEDSEPEESQTKTTDNSKYVVTADELINNDITEVPMLIESLIPKVGLTMLAGSSDTGKSSILRQLALNIVGKNENFLNYEIRAKHNSVIYVSTEDDEYALSALLKKQNPDNISNDYLKNLRFILNTEDLLKKIDAELTNKPADCVIIDAFSDIFTGEINATNIVRSFLNDYSELGRKHRTAIIFLHHTGKRTENLAPSKNNLLGSQGIESKMRVVIELRNDLQESAYRHLCIVKGNYLPAEQKNRSIKLEFNKHLLFTSTGEGVDFLDLARNEEKELEEKTAAKKRAISLKMEGKSVSEITTAMTDAGYIYARSTIGNWVQGVK